MAVITYTQALRDALAEEMRRDQSVFQIGEDIGRYGGVWGVQQGQLEEFGEMRVRQTPISECGFIGLAVGAAVAGLRPVVEVMYIDFIATAWDQVVNQAAKLRLMSGGAVCVPMVIRSEQGSGSREAAHHSQSLESWFAHTPGLKVVVPSTPYDAKGLLKTAIRDDDPVIFLEHRFIYSNKGEVPDGDYAIPFGKGIVRREGADVTVVSTSYLLESVLRVADELGQSSGIGVEVIDPRTLVPLDFELIAESVKKTGKLLVVQECTPVSSFGAEIVRRVSEECFDYLDSPPKVLGTEHIPMPFSGVLEDACMPTAEKIAAAIAGVAGGGQ